MRCGFTFDIPVTCASVRQMAVTLPVLITWKGTPSKVKDNIFCLNEEMGFTREELRVMVVKCPQLLKTFDRLVSETYDINWPAPPTIHRGLEWPQLANSLVEWTSVFETCVFSCLLACGQIF